MTRDEAQALLATRDATLAPPDARFIARWIGPLNAVVRNPQPAGDLKAWAEAMAFACERIPAAAFTPAALRALMASCQFFPSAAEVIDAVSHNAETIRHRVRIAESMCALPQNMPASRSVARVEGSVELGRYVALAAELKAASQARNRLEIEKPVIPRVLDRSELVAAYRQSAGRGNAAAKVRLQTMED